MTLKMTKSNIVMEFITIKTKGISLEEITSLLMDCAHDDKSLNRMLRSTYSQLMKNVKYRLLDGGMRLFENDLKEYTDFKDYDKSYEILKKYIQRSSKKSYLGKSKTQILEEKQINQDIKSYMKGGK